MTLLDKAGCRLAIIGATGAVGKEILSILMERKFPLSKIDFVASERSAGQNINAFGADHEVQDLANFSFEAVDIAFFSAGTDVSLEHAQRAANDGALVIDNTNAFRMNSNSPLVVPQVNGGVLKKRPSNGVIANPNCSTIQMVRVLGPLDLAFGLKQVFCATYQAASGGGLTGINELRERTQGLLSGENLPPPQKFPTELAFSVIPQIDVFQEDGSTLEEQKMRQETHKILERSNITVFPFAVRVPVENGHSIALVMHFDQDVEVSQAKLALAEDSMIRIYADETYPDIRQVSGGDHVHVARLHVDPPHPNVLYAWVAADNIRVGAALNAVEIAERAYSQRIVPCMIR
jgi:aspartate-semialdehyde dehydrogenase